MGIGRHVARLMHLSRLESDVRGEGTSQIEIQEAEIIEQGDGLDVNTLAPVLSNWIGGWCQILRQETFEPWCQEPLGKSCFPVSVNCSNIKGKLWPSSKKYLRLEGMHFVY